MRTAILTAVSAIVLSLSLACPALAKMVEAENLTVLGDNDTRAQARRVCLLEAKRKLLEQAGTYIEAQTEVDRFAVTRDEVRTFASAILAVDVVEERYLVTAEGQFAVRMKVRADIDSDDIRQRLERAVADPDGWRRMNAPGPGAFATWRTRPWPCSSAWTGRTIPIWPGAGPRSASSAPWTRSGRRGPRSWPRWTGCPSWPGPWPSRA